MGKALAARAPRRCHELTYLGLLAASLGGCASSEGGPAPELGSPFPQRSSPSSDPSSAPAALSAAAAPTSVPWPASSLSEQVIPAPYLAEIGGRCRALPKIKVGTTDDALRGLSIAATKAGAMIAWPASLEKIHLRPLDLSGQPRGDEVELTAKTGRVWLTLYPLNDGTFVLHYPELPAWRLRRVDLTGKPSAASTLLARGLSAEPPVHYSTLGLDFANILFADDGGFTILRGDASVDPVTVRTYPQRNSALNRVWLTPTGAWSVTMDRDRTEAELLGTDVKAKVPYGAFSSPDPDGRLLMFDCDHVPDSSATMPAQRLEQSGAFASPTTLEIKECARPPTTFQYLIPEIVPGGMRGVSFKTLQPASRVALAREDRPHWFYAVAWTGTRFLVAYADVGGPGPRDVVVQPIECTRVEAPGR